MWYFCHGAKIKWIWYITYFSRLFLTLHHLSWSHSSLACRIYSLLWYTYTNSTISLLLASTIMTSNSPAVAFSVTPNLSPSTEQQITHMHTPRMPLHTLSLLPVFAAALSSTWSSSQHKMHVVTHAPAHVSRCVPSWQCPARSALLGCFQLSPGYHSFCLSVHWLPVTRALCLCLFLRVSDLPLTVRWGFTYFLLFLLFVSCLPLSSSVLYPSGKGIYCFCLFCFHF